MTGQPPLDIDLAATPIWRRRRRHRLYAAGTDLLMAAQAARHPVVTGLGMLLHQAVRGFELWFGRRPVVTRSFTTSSARDIDPGYRP